MRILVAGGTGVLGTRVVELLRERGDEVSVLTRREGIAGGVSGDLATGAGLDAACVGADAVIHLATSTTPAGWSEVDVDGTRRLAEAATRQHVGHFLYISILGVDRIPFAYYRAKAEAEQEVLRAGVPWTVLRLGQFHELLDSLLRVVAALPIAFVPRGLAVQPLAAADAARVVVDTLEAGPQGRFLGAGGPQILTAKDAAEQWLAARRTAGGRGGAVVELPLPGAMMRALRAGPNLMPASMQPGTAFGDWARERFASGTGPAYRR
jgi:uncharacterized protein YbjT (DUF2867 family)